MSIIITLLKKGVCPKCGFKTLDSNLASWIRFGWDSVSTQNFGIKG